MSFRRKLLIAMAAIVFFAVGTVTSIISGRTKRAFQQADDQRTAALVTQFRHEFTRRGDEVVRRVEGIAGSETVSRMALDLSHGGDTATYLTEAKPLAETHQLDFLELLTPDASQPGESGPISDASIISSAHWPARFGYKEALASPEPAGAFLRLEPLPDGPALGLFALRAVRVGDRPVYVLGGERLDREFLASLALPSGMRAILYRNSEGGFSPQSLVTADGPLPDAGKLRPLIESTLQRSDDTSGLVHWTADLADSESFQAIPLKSDSGTMLGVLLVGNSRRDMVRLVHHIRIVGFMVGGVGILCAILLSSWVSLRVARPIRHLADAAREVGAGNWDTEVQVTSDDELGQLAEAFNRMTRELLEQRERLVQTERVAAWRELARRLAHELKNPLFPLQITVENLVRARDTEMFDEVFRESTATLLAELANLKAIIGRFSDFSRMPQPQLQPVQVNDIAKQVVALLEPQLKSETKAPSASSGAAITPRLDLAPSLPQIDADPELLHRAFTNLVLNAMDAMPEGGTVTVRTRDDNSHIRIEVADTGTGLTREECERLFTPYYTTKQHGTGLGLAIVQSVVSDHHGSITVESAPGKGSTFRIELPKLRTLAADQAG